VLALCASAQRLQTYQYSDLDGLPSRWVDDVGQGPAGRIWAATRSGLACFDGRGWRTVDAPKHLERAVRIAFDEARLWVVGEDLTSGAGCFEAGEWRTIPAPPWAADAGLVIALEVNSGGLWVATNDVLARLVDGEWRRHELTPDLKLHGLAPGPAGPLLATASGLWHVHPERVERLYPRATFAVYVDAAGEAWIVDAAGVARIVEGERVAVMDWPVPPDRALLEGTAVLTPDAAGGVYVAGPLAIFHFRAGEFTQLGVENGLPGEGAQGLILDRQQNLWVAGRRGLTRVPPQVFSSFDARDGMLQDEVSVIVEERPGELLLGHPSGLTRWNKSAPNTIDLAPRMGELAQVARVLDLVTLQGDIWVAAGYPGVIRVRAGEATSPWWLSQAEMGFVARSVVVREGELWAGTGGGLYRFVGERFVAVAGLPEAPVRKIVERDDGRLMLALFDGVLLETRSGAWQHVRHPSDPDANQVYALLDHALTGQLLAGTTAGLFAIVDGAFVEPLRVPRLEQPVFALLEDNSQRLWLGTDQGVFRWSVDGLRHYTVRDGLAGQEVNRAALVQDAAGAVWIGTDRGLSRYNEHNDLRLPPPQAELTRVVLDGREVPAAAIPSAGDLRDLLFEFRAVSFVADGRVRYRARLIGHDEEWLSGELTAAGVVRYTTLPAGRYQFEVQARDRGGEWGPSAMSATIVARGPLLQRWWFQVLLVAAIAGLGAIVFALYWTRRRSVELERLVEERSTDLAESERRYREMFEHTPMIQLLVDPDSGRVRDANPAACTQFGATREQLRGRRFVEVTGATWSAVDEVLRASEVPHVVLPADSPEERGDFDVHACSYSLRGESVVQATFVDVRERRELEEHLRRTGKLRALGQLSGGVAHDFNNLLTTILGFSDLVLRDLGPENERIREDVEAIQKAGQRGAALVRHLLAFSSQQFLKPELLSPNDVVQEMADFLSRTMGHDVRVETSLAPDVGQIEADRGEIERVLLNLALNAKRAMEKGGGVLRISTEVVQSRGADAEQEFCRITVADNGVGMSEELQARIFEPFFTTKEAYEGSGLGLSTVYGIVEQSGGSISVASRAGHGASFFVDLPLVAERSSNGEALEVGAPALAQRAALVVDDDDTIRALSVAALRAQGMRVLEAPDPQRALELAAHESFDVLVTDLTMPQMNGRELGRRLAERRPELLVLYTSGHADDVDVAELAAPRRAFLQKPFDARELVEAVRGLVGGVLV